MTHEMRSSHQFLLRLKMERIVKPNVVFPILKLISLTPISQIFTKATNSAVV